MYHLLMRDEEYQLAFGKEDLTLTLNHPYLSHPTFHSPDSSQDNPVPVISSHPSTSTDTPRSTYLSSPNENRRLIRRYNRRSLHLLRNIPIGLKHEKRFPTFTKFHSIIDFIPIDSEFNLYQPCSLERLPSSQMVIKGIIFRNGRGMVNMPSRRFPVRRQ
jgi:hypothetical protein